MIDIVERLRDKKRLRETHGLTGWVLQEERLTDEAADEIERLREELLSRHAEARKQAEEIEQLRSSVETKDSLLQEKRAEIERLRYEVVEVTRNCGRLRGLLREAIEDGYVRIPYGASHEDVSAIGDFERRIKEAL